MMDVQVAHRIIESMTKDFEPELRIKALEIWDEYKGLGPGQAVQFARELLAHPGSKIVLAQFFPASGQKIIHGS